MADNVTVDNGDLTDYTPATDEVAGVHYQKVKLFDPTTDSTSAIGIEGNPLRVSVAGLVPEEHDEIVLGYTGSNLTSVVYKLATVTLATLTLTYTGDRLDSVVRS